MQLDPLELEPYLSRVDVVPKGLLPVLKPITLWIAVTADITEGERLPETLKR